jgi:hypothetical protein
MRKLTSTLSVAALVAFPLGLIAPSALADAPHTTTVSCSQFFGPQSQGTGVTVRQADNRITFSSHCTNAGFSPPRAEKLFICSDFFADAKGQFVITPSGNIEGHCTFPQ